MCSNHLHVTLIPDNACYKLVALQTCLLKSYSLNMKHMHHICILIHSEEVTYVSWYVYDVLIASLHVLVLQSFPKPLLFISL